MTTLKSFVGPFTFIANLSDKAAEIDEVAGEPKDYDEDFEELQYLHNNCTAYLSCIGALTI